VVVTTSGSLNTAAMGSSNQGSTIEGLWPSLGFFQTGNTAPLQPGDQYTSLPNASRSPSFSIAYWGAGSRRAGNSATGALFAVDFSASYLLVPSGYTTGTSLAGTLTLTGQTLAGLGITSLGTYTLTFGSGASTDSVTVYLGTTPPAPSAVPTLSEWSQMLLGLLVMTLLGWHFQRERSY
jgi:hypothetical protein